jgi:hypothetical protein
MGEFARIDLIPHGGCRATLEAGPEQCEKGICYEQEEKDVVGDSGILRGGFGDTAEEETNGYLDDADGREEDDLADDCEL